MIIEESILINADLKIIWKTFINLAGWAEWNTVTRDIVSDSGIIEQNERFRFRIRPYLVPVTVKVKIEEVVSGEKVVWTGAEFGVFSRHEFLFQHEENSVLVTSRETFWGLPFLFGGITFPEGTVRELTIQMLSDLKKAAEKSTP